MAAARHLVARQTLEVHSAERMVSERLAARAMAASALLAEAIESSLDAAGAVDVRFRIDRLEVDLGPCDPGHWERDLAEGIRAHLAAGLAAAFKEGRAGPVEPLAAALALVAHFCRSGSLPWWARPADSPETAVRALAHCASATGLLGELLLEAEAVERLVNQLREPFLVLLLETVRPGLGGAGGAFIDELEAAARKAAAARGAQAPGRKQIWRSVLTEAGTALSARNSPGLLRSGSPEAGNQAFERSIAAGLGLDAAMPPTQAPGLKEAAKGFAPAAGARSASLEERRAAFTDHIQTLARRGDANFSQAALRALVGQLDEAALGAAELLLERAGPEAALEALRQPPPHSFIAQAGAGAISETLPPHGPDRSEDEHDCLWIETAGLVLLWPFLPSFFERLGLTARPPWFPLIRQSLQCIALQGQYLRSPGSLRSARSSAAAIRRSLVRSRRPSQPP